MLEAVHLLLALDLFVVVVAVDSRWLTRALEVYYHDLLTAADGPGGDGLRASTPQSYLEKIFQVTYALGPMDPGRFGDYVAFLAGEEADGKTPAQAATGADTAASPAAGATPSADAPGDAGRSAQAQAGDKAQPAKEPVAPAAKLPPAPGAVRRPQPPVRIGKDERDFIVRLVPLLPTPRIAKRLVNVYRVIKARKSVVELDAFEREGRDRTCLLMLAILFGRPAIAAELLRALHEERAPFDNPEEALIEALGKRCAPAGEPAGVHDAWEKLAATLKAIGITESVGRCAREPMEVARYSLVTGHDWHTWSRPPAKKLP
jgi:hypothetical protein